MSFWQKLFSSNSQLNAHKNHITCVENDCACKSNEQLIDAMLKAQDEDVVQGIKKVLVSRGYSKKELAELIHSKNITLQ